MATADAAERAAKAKKKTTSTSVASLPEWAQPPVWGRVAAPLPTIPAPSARVASAPGVDRYISVTPTMFSNTFGVAQSQTAEEAWADWVAKAGIEPLGVPTNWWPGIGIANYDEMIQGLGLLEGSDRRFAAMFPQQNRPEFWAAPSTEIEWDDPDTPQPVDMQAWVRYDPATAAQQYMLMGGASRAKYTELMVRAGYLDEEWAGISEFDPQAAAAFSKALSWANYYGKSVDEVLASQGDLFQKLSDRAGGGGGGGGGPQVKIEVPNYETLTQQAKDTLRQNLGRDPKDWEMTLVADEMQRQYGDWASATKARMVGGNGIYEIPDPATLTQAFVEKTYEDELTRLEDVGDTTQVNRLLIAAATKGTDMLGSTLG